MPPPSVTATETYSNGTSKPSTIAPHEPGLSEQQATVQMPKFPGPPEFENKYEERDYLKGRLAAAFRIFGKYGFDEGVAGHITLRDPVDPTTFWVNPFGVAFSLMRKRDLIQVDHNGNIIDGGEVRLLNAAAYMIHAAVHSARPEDHVLYTAFNGIVLAEKEGHDIAACLGDKKAALLQNHGLLTVGQSVEEAVFWFISLEKCCHAQLMADAAAAGRGGETKKIGNEEAAFTYKTIGTPIAGWFSAKPEFEKILKAEGQEFLQ